MEAKKSEKEKTENKRGTLYLIGFVVALSFAYITLEWSRENAPVWKPVAKTIENIEPIYNIPRTRDLPPAPPPAPINAVDEFKVVDRELQKLEDETPTVEPTETGDTKSPVITGPVTQYTVVEEEDPITFAEIMPRFNGDVNEYLSKNIKYPQIAIETNIQGRVTCQFVINRDGSIVDVEVVRSVDPSLDREAVRVIKSMPKWRPGIQNGKPVRVRFFLPVVFRLM